MPDSEIRSMVSWGLGGIRPYLGGLLPPRPALPPHPHDGGGKSGSGLPLAGGQENPNSINCSQSWE